jgi:hypothetical protein
VLSASDIEVDDSEWDPLGGEPNTWQNKSGDLFSLQFFAIPPDIPCPLSGLEPLRRLHRERLRGVGAVVEVEADEVDGLRALRTILKFAQRPAGMTYVGGFIVPFRDCSFSLQYECPERGVTGIRDAVVIEKLGLLKADVAGSGWFKEPYDPTFKALPLRNRSDDAEWDALFPAHPLTRLRNHLRRARGTTFDPAAQAEPPFAGPSPEA